MKHLPLGFVPKELGALPDKMLAYTIRPDRQGEPQTAMQREEVDLPTLGAQEVLVLVMAAGVNYNGVWAARGKPVSVFDMHNDPFHIAGSDASGIVWKVGSEVIGWKPGDEVVLHCSQSNGQSPECNGLDPLACSSQRIWGYETSWGSFAQFAKVQCQQLLKKPKHLSWTESASYGLTYFTAFRMLVDKAQMKPGQNVLIWGAAGGLGVFAVQLCLLAGVTPVCVVSGEDKIALLQGFGAKLFIDRRKFDLSQGLPAQKAFGKEIRRLTGGEDCDIVFEHVGKETFPTSVFVCKRFGKIVICGATTGYELTFDVRYLWMRQKEILGSHFANLYQATRANKLVHEQRIRPVVDQIFEFDQIPEAHQLMADNKHKGKMVVRIQGDR